MESIYVPLGIVGGLSLFGAILQTLNPSFFSETVQENMKAITIAILGILFSTFFMMWIIKIRAREGFENVSFLTRWETLIQDNKVNEVCKLYNELYEKMLAVEKGAPPDQKTDAQARESVAKKFAEVMKQSLVSCPLVDEMNKAKTLDTFYEGISKVPEKFLLQVHDTAMACRRLLIDSYLKIKDAERRQKEGFVDKPICDEETAKQRRANVEAQSCILPEEVPKEQKESVITRKLDQIESFWKPYRENLLPENGILKILEDCAYYKDEIEKKGKEAEEMSNKFQTK